MTDNKVCAATGPAAKSIHLFEVERLTKLSTWEAVEAGLKKKNLLARPLKSTDYENGYLGLLSQLTDVGDISKHDFTQRFNRMKTVNETDEHYAIVVIEDINTGKVVGAASLIMELKFIHQCAMKGKVEEVVVLNEYRSKKIGATVVKILVDLAREIYKCYKISLDCTDSLIPFYDKIGFKGDRNSLSIYFNK